MDLDKIAAKAAEDRSMKIKSIIIYGPVGEYGEAEAYQVGCDVGGGKVVTEIRQTIKSGMHADIPYVQVWYGDELYAEFCQHNIQGVYYEPSTPTVEDE